MGTFINKEKGIFMVQRSFQDHVYSLIPQHTFSVSRIRDIHKNDDLMDLLSQGWKVFSSINETLSLWEDSKSFTTVVHAFSPSLAHDFFLEILKNNARKQGKEKVFIYITDTLEFFIQSSDINDISFFVDACVEKLEVTIQDIVFISYNYEVSSKLAKAAHSIHIVNCVSNNDVWSFQEKGSDDILYLEHIIDTNTHFLPYSSLVKALVYWANICMSKYDKDFVVSSAHVKNVLADIDKETQAFLSETIFKDFLSLGTLYNKDIRAFNTRVCILPLSLLASIFEDTARNFATMNKQNFNNLSKSLEIYKYSEENKKRSSIRKCKNLTDEDFFHINLYKSVSENLTIIFSFVSQIIAEGGCLQQDFLGTTNRVHSFNRKESKFLDLFVSQFYSSFPGNKKLYMSTPGLDAHLVSQEENENDDLPSISVFQDDDGRTIIDITELASDKKTREEEKPVVECVQWNDMSILKKALCDNIFGQDIPIENIVEELSISAAGLHNPEKPLKTFLFLGTTGIGKTKMASLIAEHAFQKPVNIIRLDMSEYASDHEVAKLFGAPPGYIGHTEGGSLTNQVKKNPQSVIILDEIEKAHPRVWDPFLQVFDAGRMTSGSGETIDFSQCIIIMTSNLGVQELQKMSSGFNSSDPFIKTREECEKIIVKELEKTFRPEFINRIDSLIFFNSLNDDIVKEIIKKELFILRSRLDCKNISVNFDDTVVSYVASKSSIHKYGAREVQRIVNKYVTTPLARYILNNKNSCNIHAYIYRDVLTLGEDNGKH